jgi:hypothetical protein
MKKAVIIALAAALLGFAAVSYAHMGGGGWGMQGWGYGQGCGPAAGEDKDVQKALDETVDMRRDLHGKMFDYMEASRKGDKEKAEALEKEIDALQDKLGEKLGYGKRAGRRGMGMMGMGPGMMMAGGPGCGCYSR